MNQIRAGIDFDALNAGAGHIGQAAEAFFEAAGRVGGLPPAAAPRQQATDLLDRVIDAMAGAFRAVQTELSHHSAGLTTTAASYRQAEETLAHWQIPGWGS